MDNIFSFLHIKKSCVIFLINQKLISKLFRGAAKVSNSGIEKCFSEGGEKINAEIWI